MKERPILFSSEMVRAILEGRKTQTRRVMKEPWKVYLPNIIHGDWPIGHYTFVKPGIHSVVHNQFGAISVIAENHDCLGLKPSEFQWICPYGNPGDLLWVRETWMKFNGKIIYRADKQIVIVEGYAADGTSHGIIQPWRPSIFMPRWASRIMLKITNVRVERLQDISVADCLSEGILPIACDEDASELYEALSDLWDSINAKPKSVYIDEVINHYVSYPFGGENETRSYRGKLWYILPNPWVWVIEFERVEK